MDMIQQVSEIFHFLRPWAGLTLLALLVLMYQIKQGKQRSGGWGKVCSPELLAYLQVGSGSVKGRTLPMWMVAWVGLCLTIALAGPVWKKIPQPIYQSDSALVIALDLSLSMDAQDIKPSRLERAKQKLTDLLRMHRDGQTALIVFAGTAHVVTPLTTDVETILSQLRELSTDLMPKQGGNLDAAMLQAMALFKQSSVAHGVVLLMTDSNHYSDAVVQQWVQAGHRLDVIGIGTQEGAPIPKKSGGFLSDRQGNIIMPSLDMASLQHIAALGHGTYHTIQLQHDDLDDVLAQLKPLAWQDGHVQKAQQTYDTWYEEGPWLLLLVMPFVLMGFRRGVLVVMLVASLHASPVEAFEWDDMWQTPQAKGQALMHEKKYAQAAKQLERNDWKLSAHYKQGNHKAAIEDFKHIKQPTADDVYNYGNALAHAGKLDAAIEAYKKSLAMKPSLQDAKDNMALLEKLKNKNEQKQEQKKKKSSKDGKKGKQGDKPSKSKQPHKDDDSKQHGDKASKAKQEKSTQGQSSDKKTNQPKQQSQEKKPSNQQSSKQQKMAKQQEKNQQEKSKQEKSKQAAKQVKQSQHALSKDELKKLEKKQAFEQTIRRVPDNPGGLLRRKFLYQYQQQHQQNSSNEGDVAW
ncbi:MAG: VWA domain-containing protein [Mariprofundaceae bacterium]|nr:VWA domain-containing protein [Mariprofundaceae bacterium]